VTIKDNEAFIIDKAYEKGWMVPKKIEKRTGKTVAVIGSGPCGSSGRRPIKYRGTHSVTVFEREDRIGGTA
jgi:glutamate synthase (NADPH/NADH) small chain